MQTQHCPSRRLIILGSTGSIGVNTLDVVEHLRSKGLFDFEVVGLAAGSSATVLLQQADRFRVGHIAIADHESTAALNGFDQVFSGPDAALELIESVAKPGDLVVGAMVGSAGIPAILAAIGRGCDIALANKETLVAAGEIVMPLVRKHRVDLLPIDSEHSAVFQCLHTNPAKESRDGAIATDSIKRVVITASGGPFRTWSTDEINNATVEEALNHPTWNMGPKVTIDSATMMNKALEIIEAHWLFDLPAEKIEVIVHPQSIVHSFVEFVDGSVLAQLGPPDMRTPIQCALTWPNRVDGNSRTMKWEQLRHMDFEPVDHDRFGAIGLAYEVIRAGGTSGAIVNAANEAAVAAFMEGRIGFGQITELVREALRAIEPVAVHTMSDVRTADRAARESVAGSCSANGLVRR
ncbi:MAG: 1-deoxy-D-xylulose-5-phosphate reductoisomerase [Phycisphaerales bacterium]|nr:1-deoxy-D-xylulose-5-phosphate reductoisomerase [Phycisphaerales bacterium]